MIAAIEEHLLLPSPIHEISSFFRAKLGIQIFLKRDDLIHPHICGNKWRKLKYNFQKAEELGSEVIISFGGGFSNHLVAVAAAGYFAGVSTVGIIRSFTEELENPTISILRDYKMKLKFVRPDIYKKKEHHPDIAGFLRGFSNYHLIPEGGTNRHSLRGVMEMIEESATDQLELSHVVVGIGTGGTLAGVVKALIDKDIMTIGVSPFKGAISQLEGFQYLNKSEHEKLVLIRSVPESRFGSFDEQSFAYLKNFKVATGIMLDPVYTVKVMMTIENLIRQNYFPEGSKILIVHTGGIQGIDGYAFRYNCKF